MNYLLTQRVGTPVPGYPGVTLAPNNPPSGFCPWTVIYDFINDEYITAVPQTVINADIGMPTVLSARWELASDWVGKGALGKPDNWTANVSAILDDDEKPIMHDINFSKGLPQWGDPIYIAPVGYTPKSTPIILPEVNPYVEPAPDYSRVLWVDGQWQRVALIVDPLPAPNETLYFGDPRLDVENKFWNQYDPSVWRIVDPSEMTAPVSNYTVPVVQAQSYADAVRDAINSGDFDEGSFNPSGIVREDSPLFPDAELPPLVPSDGPNMLPEDDSGISPPVPSHDSKSDANSGALKWAAFAALAYALLG